MARPSPLVVLVRAIVAGDAARAARLIAAAPELAREQSLVGATRAESTPWFFDEIAHYLFEGDTALHLAAAAYQRGIARRLLARGADVRARNRRGAEPLHYATDGAPGSQQWNPRAQAATAELLIAAGADPNAADDGGVTPLHRAVRNRCAAVVRVLLAHGADPQRKNGKGTTALKLALLTTGRGGSGTAQAKAQQTEIVRLLKS